MTQKFRVWRFDPSTRGTVSTSASGQCFLSSLLRATQLSGKVEGLELRTAGFSFRIVNLYWVLASIKNISNQNTFFHLLVYNFIIVVN